MSVQYNNCQNSFQIRNLEFAPSQHLRFVLTAHEDHHSPREFLGKRPPATGSLAATFVPPVNYSNGALIQALHVGVRILNGDEVLNIIRVGLGQMRICGNGGPGGDGAGRERKWDGLVGKTTVRSVWEVLVLEEESEDGEWAIDEPD
ncbi:uncharacterized protein J3R85_002887 [Psidium guajava]|nr:uncharacterized protein J3R85_002887 [Psidium guajava]